MDRAPQITVLGAGSWGTALALLLARNGARVTLWGFLREEVEQLQSARENRTYLPGHPFPGNLQSTSDLEAALKGADEVLVAVPSHAFRQTLEGLSPLLSDATPLSWATKGLEPQTGELLHNVAREILGAHRPLALVSGPSFAKEVAAGLPTAVTVAATEADHGERLADYLRSGCFRAYTSDDITGLEVGGAAKNVMAIAAGIADGLGFGANARAALITRGLAEILRLAQALGGRQETLISLGGLGDLVLTCTDDLSRNRRMGLALARGLGIDEARAEIGQEVEGIMAAREIHHRAQTLGIEMPLTEQTYRVLYQGLDPRNAAHNLFMRSPKAENA
ncbi:MAG: NAD(P)-dependent glycerol-3-phosphate dehydrogenase [gamma proteobacterium symbiont of Phacoides pectinatus]